MATPETSGAGTGSPAARLPLWLELILVAAILLLAGWLRMAAPGLTEFKADEARLLGLAYDMAEGRLALRGISSSVGVPNFPASVWLYALPVAIWPHPYAATLFTGLLSTIAVGLTYWFSRRYWGTAAALAAALMYAVSPWAIIFSRKIWAQNLLPLFVLGWAIGAALALVEKRPRALWLHFVCLALAVQIHLAAVALVPATLLLLIVFRRNIRWRDVLVGGLLAALTMVPFAVYLWRDESPAQVLGGSSALPASGVFSLDALRQITLITLGSQIHSLAGAPAFTQYLSMIPDMTLVHGLWGLLILGGVLILVWLAWRQWSLAPSQAGFIVLIWLLLPLLVFLWQWTPVFIHYFIAVLPAPYIAAGVFFGVLPRGVAALWPTLSLSARRLLIAAVWTLLLLTAVLQVSAWLTLQDFLGGTATPGGFGIPLAKKLDAVQEIQTLMAETGAQEVLVAGEGESPAIDAFPAEWDVLLRDVPRRFVDARRHALFPAAAAVVLLDGRLDPALSTGDLYTSMATTERIVPLRSGEGSYQVLAMPGDARPKQEIPLQPPLLLANWVHLLGYDQPLRAGSESAVWQVHWRTGDNSDPAAYQFFNHLQDSQGNRISQIDAAAFDPQQWRAGDTLISRFLMPWPETAAGPFTMRVGMYRYPSLEAVPLLDVAGNPYSEAAEFPLGNE